MSETHLIWFFLLYLFARWMICYTVCHFPRLHNQMYVKKIVTWKDEHLFFSYINSLELYGPVIKIIGV